MATDAAETAPVPAARPARRGAVSPDAAARVPRRAARLLRARALRGALPAALGAAGALRREVRAGREQQPAPDAARSRRPAAPIVDRDGRALVVNVPGTRVELWPADLPKRWPEQRDELRRLSKIVGVPVRTISTPDERARAATRSRRSSSRPASTRTRSSYLFEHGSAASRASASRTATSASTRTSRWPRRSLGHVGEITAAGAEGAAEARATGSATSIGQAGVEADLRHLPPRPRRLGAAHRRRARPPDERDRAEGQPAAAGNTLRLTIDIGLQRAAERALRYGIELAREDKHWHANGGCDRRARPARRRGARDGVVPDLQAVALRRPQRREEARAAPRPEGRGEGELPRAQPRDRRHVPAGLDVQAGDGARRDAGARPAPVRDASSAPASTTRRTTAASRSSRSGTGRPVRVPVDGAADGARGVVRHLLLPGGRPVLRAPVGAAAHPLQYVGDALRASARRPGSTSAPRRPG